MHASQKVLVSSNHLVASPSTPNRILDISLSEIIVAMKTTPPPSPTVAPSYSSKGVNNFGKLDGPSQAPQSFDPRQGCSGHCETCHADYL
jgi:hypothetical protein